MENPAAKRSIELVLASHTNIGKTSLARTLLGRDVGDVRDEAHVTQFSDRYTWQEAAQGESLKLWDTPGFGDSQRLLKRMQKAGTLRGWLLTEVWDRWLYPGFHFSQKVLRTVQEEADVVLYLVSAAEPPETAAYLDSEMQLLECIGKPVIVIINQMAGDQDLAQEAADVAQWQAFFARYPHIISVLPLDAFARCWVQEFVLLEAIQAALQDDASHSLMGRLLHAWTTDGLAVFNQSMQIIADGAARCALTRERVDDSGKLRAVASNLMTKANAPRKQQGAERALSKTMRVDTEKVLAELARLYHLDATVENDIAVELGHVYHPKKGVSETRFTLLSAVLTGMLSGLAADIAVGGLSLGSGMIVGGIAGAVGGKAAALGYNRVAGTTDSWVEWDADALDALVERLIMSYLIIAHAGRARGKSVLKREHPRWLLTVPSAIEVQRGRLRSIWGTRGTDLPLQESEQYIAEALLPVLGEITWHVLEQLYPHVTKLRGQTRTSAPAAKH